TSKPRLTSSAVTRSMFSSAVCFCITMTMGSPLSARLALHATRLVDDSFKKTPHSDRIERPLGDPLDVLEDVLLPLRRIDGQSEHALQLADLDGVLGALVEEADDHFVDAIDGVPETR